MGEALFILVVLCVPLAAAAYISEKMGWDE